MATKLAPVPGRSKPKTDARYAAFAEAVCAGIWIVGADGRIEEVNALAAECLDRPERELVGRELVEFVAPEDRERAAEEFERRLGGDTSRRESELRVMRPDGERRQLQLSSAPILDEGRVRGVCWVARDLTEERGRETHLRRAERLASVAPLLSGVCHELNNPLTSIRSFTELLLLDDRSPEDREALEIVLREATRAARTVSDLRLVAGQGQSEDQDGAVFDLNELVTTLCAAIEAECCLAGIELQTELATDLAGVFGERAQLSRALSQILDNAVQAMRGHDGPQRLRVQTLAGTIGPTLVVEDTGPGIRPEDTERIFDPFWSTRTTGQGTGLGLSLAHSIISDHQGRIRVDGGWERGATFTIELPAAARIFNLPRHAEVQAPAQTPLRILVVDDEAPIRYTLIRYMARRGHTVLEAEEGEKALGVLAELDASGERPDVILADLRMPGLGGPELLLRLRERGDGLEDRLIFITGDADGVEVANTLACADVPIVLKPFELAEIAQIIEAHADACRFA